MGLTASGRSESAALPFTLLSEEKAAAWKPANSLAVVTGSHWTTAIPATNDTLTDDTRPDLRGTSSAETINRAEMVLKQIVASTL